MGKTLNDSSIPLGFNTVDNTYFMSIVHPTTGKIFKLTPPQFIALYGGQLNKQTGTSYTASLGDANGVIEMNNASANSVTIPPNSSVPYPIGTQFAVSQYGAGQTSIIAGGGVTIRNIGNVAAQYGSIFIYKRATDEWVMSGGTSSSLTTPAAPTAGTVNDTNGIDTFDWTNSAGYTLVSDYEFTLDGGSTYSTLTAKPLVVGNINKAIGQVGVRVKAHTGTTVSATLFNASAFTSSGGGTTLNAPVLSTPTVISSTELDLVYTDPNSSPNESSLELQYSNDNSTWNALATPAANSTTYNDTSVPTGGTLRYYRIRAVGNGTTTITSAWSNVVNATTSSVWSYAQNFDAVTPPAMPADWVHTGAFTAAYGLATSSPNVMEMPANGSAVMTAMKNAIDGHSGNIRVSINVKVVSANPHEIIIVGRASTTSWATMTAYGLKIWINNGTSATNGVSLLKGVGGTFNALGSGTSVGNGATLAANVWYKFTLVMTDVGGSTKVDAIVQRVSDGFYLNSSGTFVTGAEQIAYTNTDSSPITGAGYGGIASFIINTAEHVMDDFLMTQ